MSFLLFNEVAADVERGVFDERKRDLNIRSCNVKHGSVLTLANKRAKNVCLAEFDSDGDLRNFSSLRRVGRPLTMGTHDRSGDLHRSVVLELAAICSNLIAHKVLVDLAG